MKTVTYLDFGTPRIHLARPSYGPRPRIAMCGMGRRLTGDPGSFDDRPGLYPNEICKRCKELAAKEETEPNG